MEWTEARIAELSRLWKAGNSASQCARMLGNTTRAAVIGKVHRLGIAARGAAAVPQPKPAKAAPKQPVVREVTSASREHPSPQVAARVMASDAIVSLEPFMCRWPIGDPTLVGFRFCGQRAKLNGPYCDAHRVSAYQNRPTQKLRA